MCQLSFEIYFCSFSIIAVKMLWIPSRQGSSSGTRFGFIQEWTQKKIKTVLPNPNFFVAAIARWLK
jgi:hypothetical protein